MSVKFIRHRAVLAFFIFDVQAGFLYVGGALLVSFMRSFGTTPSQLGLVLGAGWVAGVLGSLMGGHLSDRIGPKQTVLFSGGLAALGLLGQALARNWVQAGVALLTVTGAQTILFPAATALLGFALEKEVGSALGFLNTAFSAAAIPGALVTGMVVRSFGWPAVFGGKVALYLVSLAFLAVMLPEARGKAGDEAPMGGGWREMLTHPGLLLVGLSVLVVTLGGYCYTFYPYFVQARFSADVRALALFDSLYNAIWTLSNWPAGMLADRLGRDNMAIAGYLLVGMAWLIFPFAPSLPFAYVIYSLYCLGNSMGFYATVFAMDLAPEELKGRAVGFFNALMNVGGAVGDVAGGRLWEMLGARVSFVLAFVGYMTGAMLLRMASRGKGGQTRGQDLATDDLM